MFLLFFISKHLRLYAFEFCCYAAKKIYFYLYRPKLFTKASGLCNSEHTSFLFLSFSLICFGYDLEPVSDCESIDLYLLLKGLELYPPLTWFDALEKVDDIRNDCMVKTDKLRRSLRLDLD